MANNIKVGDLVMIVKRTPCCNKGTVGAVFTVAGFDSAILVLCAHCGHAMVSPDCVVADRGSLVLTSRLRKIDPLTEPEHIEQPEELTV